MPKIIKSKKKGMNAGLIHYRTKGTRTFVFLFEGGARQFANWLTDRGVKFDWAINLSACRNEITIL